MIYRVRELAGWILVVMGVFVFGATYFVLILNGKIFEAGPAVLIGIFLFRGGIHLLKVAVAAQMCLQAQPKPTPGRQARMPDPRGVSQD